MTDAITREEKLLAGIAIEPITREEMFLAKLAGQDVQTLKPITRKEMLLSKAIENGGGSSGGIKPEGTITITENGTHDVAEYASAEVMVSGGGDDVLNAVIDGSIINLNSEATSVATYKFYNNKGLDSVNLPKAKTIYYYAFQGCVNLKTLNIPMVETIESSAFDGCSNLISVQANRVMNIRSSAFAMCPKLETITLNWLHSIGSEAFRACSALKVADLGNVSTIDSSAFHYCTALKTIIIRRTNGTCTLKNVNAFTGTPFASGGTGGTVYVPQALIERYKTATNWSSLYAAGTCNFVAIEGSEYDV